MKNIKHTTLLIVFISLFGITPTVAQEYKEQYKTVNLIAQRSSSSRTSNYNRSYNRRTYDHNTGRMQNGTPMQRRYTPRNCTTLGRCTN